MCYFQQTRWSCGWWRWGHFKQQCPKEYRTGETCGMKLVYETTFEEDRCKICKDIDKKQRKYTKLQSDIYRWQREGNRSATIERAERDIMDVETAIQGLEQQHYQRVHETL
ncbi:hypothetical protein PG984_013043 [Apiospora sp. TS-2023a]